MGDASESRELNKFERWFFYAIGAFFVLGMVFIFLMGFALPVGGLIYQWVIG